MPKKHPYTCPRCEYNTSKKSDIHKHFYVLKKTCPAIKQDIELTDNIKQYILDNRIYNDLKQNMYANNQHTTKQSDKMNKKYISHALKVKCWDTYIGVEIGKSKCLCCNHNYIMQHTFHCGHVIAESKGGTHDISNLRPICSVCNHSMGTNNMDEFKINQCFT
jgi:5-methylcytosine-specific restriction endonuclease McrA